MADLVEQGAIPSAYSWIDVFCLEKSGSDQHQCAPYLSPQRSRGVLYILLLQATISELVVLPSRVLQVTVIVSFVTHFLKHRAVVFESVIQYVTLFITLFPL